MNKKDDKKYITELCDELKKIGAEKAELTEKNKELIKLLNSKRYKAVDFVTDTVYRLAHRVSKKQKIIDSAAVVKKKIVDSTRDVVIGKVDIININFYDWDGKVVYKGGAERYVYDLACLLKKMGYKVRILQCSNMPFEKIYKGIQVVGVGAGDKSNMRACSAVYNYYCRDAEFVIASPLELASEIQNIPVIGINHGVNFDDEYNKYNSKCLRSYDVHMDALKNVVSCVCVDTNFINFTRTQDYALSLKERYIPNYYDSKQFARVRVKKDSEKIIFIYPRRLYNARGVDITIEAFEKILPDYKDKVILNFVGQIDNSEAGAMLDSIMSKYPKNVFHYEYSMDEMPKAYKDADVVLVPTRYSEGTSLSCIEGMASGAAIIATDVGGLTNLVIDGFNGKLISPTVDDLVDAVLWMIKKPKERVKLAENGLAVVREAFTKEKWDKSWQKEIKRVSGGLEKLES